MKNNPLAQLRLLVVIKKYGIMACPKVSVIIPVYNTEKYIERCACSLFGQTLDDIEYLFVNDCSTDASMEILNQVLERYPHRKAQVVIHNFPVNSGACAVREWGMRHALGEYVIQCDSDDWVERTMYQTLYEVAEREHSDVVICDYAKAYARKLSVKKGCRTTDRNALLEDLLSKKSSWAVWNKLFRRTLWTSGFIYPKDSMGEDMAIVTQLVCKARRVSYHPECLYYYAIHPSSLVRSKTAEKSEAGYRQQLNNTEIVLKVLASCGDFPLRRAYVSFLYFLASINYTPLAYHDRGCLQKWREACPGVGFSFFLSQKIPFRYKFKYMKLSFLHFLTISIRNNHNSNTF